MITVKTLTKAQSDPGLREAGVWAEVIVAGSVEPLKLRLRSLSSNKARMWDLARFRKQRAYYVGDGLPPIEVIDQNEADKLAEALVLEWNISQDDGTPLPCATETVRAVMLQLPDSRRDAMAEAGKHENYRLKQVEELAGNSAGPSMPSSGAGAAAQ
jgi:hypothetical protein